MSSLLVKPLMSAALRMLALNVVLVGASVPTQALASSGPKLAVVDVQAVVTSAPIWKDAVGKLEKTLKAMQAGIENKKSELQERRHKLEAKKAVSDSAALDEEEAQLAGEEQQLVQAFMASQQRLTAAENKLKAAMLQRVQQVVEVEGAGGDFDYVFDVGDPATPNVLYAAKKIDITARVIEGYKKAFGDKPLDVNLDEIVAP
ncbi:MAG: OmpH family outer membrane protein [Deltaproteobacteria bacterium]|nr:OmpH family outer membrane protein [Deltaproteobacteria bacterium]